MDKQNIIKNSAQYKTKIESNYEEFNFKYLTFKEFN